MVDDANSIEPQTDAAAAGREKPFVLPYRPVDETDLAAVPPPSAMVHRQFGILAFGFSVAAVVCVVGGSLGAGRPAAAGCCLGLLPWLMSATLAAVVAVRDGPGRPWALLALLVDALLLGVLVVVERSHA